MNQYQKLYTPADSAIVFIDQQPQMTFAVASSDRATMINNVTLLARVAKEFTFPLEWLKLTVDPSANAPEGPDAFGPFSWIRMIQ